MADSLLFDGSDDFINFSPGDISGTGALSMVAIIKLTSDEASYRNIFGWNALDTGFYTNPGPGENLLYYTGVALDQSSFAVAASEGWLLVAFTKPSGSSAGRFHKYVYGTTTWTHVAGNDPEVSPVACTVFRVGINGDGTNPLDANYLIAGFWDSELSDATIETLELDQQAWTDALPDEAWRFDTMDAISSFAGGASAQTSRTGTTLDTGDAPAGWTDIPPPTPIIRHDYSLFPKAILRPPVRVRY